MEADVVQYGAKINSLLAKLLEPDFHFKNDTYMSVLLSHLSGKENEELGRALIGLPVFTEWLVSSLPHWESSCGHNSQTVTTFVLQLVGLLSKDEGRFVRFNATNYYVRLCSAFQVRNPNVSPSVKLAYVQLLSSFLTHGVGLDWIMATEYWQDVLNISLANQTIYIVKEGYGFMYELLSRAVGINEVFCDLVIGRITHVLGNIPLPNGVCGVAEINNEQLKVQLAPTLKLLTHVLESYVKSENLARGDFRIPSLLLGKYQLEQAASKIVLVCKDEELLCDVYNVMILCFLLSPSVSNESSRFKSEDVMTACRNMFKFLKTQVMEGPVVGALKFCHMGQHYWKLIKPSLPGVLTTPEPEQTLEGQLLVFQLMPIAVLSFQQCDINFDNLEDDFRENFVIKIFKSLKEGTIRMMYTWRTTLAMDENVVGNAQKAIMYVMKSRKLYNKDMAVIVFQCFMYSLQDVVRSVKRFPEKIAIYIKQDAYFRALMDAIATLIKEFGITWRECIESVCVMNVSMDFVALTNWSPKLIVQALKLMNVSIEEFMIPNLALLVDRTHDSSMSLLEPMLTSRLHDVHWEIRDSALEVLHTICEIAQTKFPSFQNMITNSDLIKLVLTMCKCDSEGFVRASALKCLQEMIKISAFWNEVLEREDLPGMIIGILQNETEAIVRCEAASLMCVLYEHQNLSPNVMDGIYNVMVFAAVSDLHWEVKVNALSFWNKVICNRLSNQGMIDGTFPNVTFSKEHRKIVTLTDKEVKNRLNKVLVELSKCGCLAVLVAAVQDEYDLEVTKKGVQVTKTLSELLNAYNMTGDVSANPVSPKAVMDTFNLVGSSPTAPIVDTSDSIIDQIVNSKDIHLLANVFNSQDVAAERAELRQVAVVTPQTFLSFIQRDLDSIINEKQKWINKIDDLHSLLDDMLKTYDTTDINSMDCY